MKLTYLIPKRGDKPRGRELAKQRLILALNDLDPDETWLVSVGVARHPRSEEQLGYYHGVVVRTFARETGNDEATVRHWWANKFLPKVVIKYPDGSTNVKDNKPEDCTMDVVAEFIDRCIAFAADWGVVIPPPRVQSPE